MSAEAYTEDWLKTPPPNPIHIYSRLYKPDAPKALLVFIHGFQEHVGRYTWTHTQLKACGIAVFAIDQRGFGRTAFGEKGVRRGTGYGRTGIDLQMRDIEFVLGVARERVPGVPVFLSGHSMVRTGCATRYDGAYKRAGRWRSAQLRVSWVRGFQDALRRHRVQSTRRVDEPQVEADTVHRWQGRGAHALVQYTGEGRTRGVYIPSLGHVLV